MPKVDEKYLLDLKTKIEKAKTEMNELAGRKAYLMDELKTKWDCGSIEDAEKLEEKLDKILDELETLIEKKRKQLNDTYDI